MSYCQSCADLQTELTRARAQRDELAAALRSTNALLAATVPNLTNSGAMDKKLGNERLTIRGLLDTVKDCVESNRAALAKVQP